MLGSKRMRSLTPVRALAALLAASCGDDRGGADGEVTDSLSTSTATTTGSDETSSTGVKLDVSPDTGVMPVCVVVDDMDAPPPCGVEAPPDSFEPEIQWVWWGPEGDDFSTVTPLVGNLTDDDGDGDVDLCDVPDIVIVTTFRGQNFPARVFALDGATGEAHFQTDEVQGRITPALGDIDGDGVPEIVAASRDGLESTILAFENDGSTKFKGDQLFPLGDVEAIALADLDNDGDVEILAGNVIFDHEGKAVVTLAEPPPSLSATTAADLDGDGDLEVVFGHAAYHHDGTELFVNIEIGEGFPQVANFDDDPEPEILVTTRDGLSMVEHDGVTVFSLLTPTGDPVGAFNWIRPATIDDFDGDGAAEFAMSSANNYTLYEADASIVWSAPVADLSGLAAGTAFDFLGDGIAEAMYADEHTMYIFDGQGIPLLQITRSSGTQTEYPIVADIDNDGSAEIVVVSALFEDEQSPTVQVIRDQSDRWIQARRIWNQHTYHVTNVREDGTIPQFEKPHWTLLNTFRTNAQIEGGQVCDPPVG